MADRFTPGPWGYHDHNWRGEPTEFDFYVSGNPGGGEDGERYSTAVAIVKGNATAEDIPMANARLIAAAPDLLAACRALVETFELADMGDEPEDSEYGDGKRALLAGLAAIAKATGQ